jgi:hypothetical protein
MLIKLRIFKLPLKKVLGILQSWCRSKSKLDLAMMVKENMRGNKYTVWGSKLIRKMEIERRRKVNWGFHLRNFGKKLILGVLRLNGFWNSMFVQNLTAYKIILYHTITT